MILSGRTIAVTRPQGQDSALIAAISAHGGTALASPLIEICPLNDVEALRAVSSRLDAFAWAIFISANAVHHSLPSILALWNTWPATVRTAAVGPGTAQALATYGISDCLLPEGQFDSEHLLARTELQTAAVQGKNILLVRGEGGRELLANTLQHRGAKIEALPCYRRTAPKNLVQPLQTAWQNNGLDGILLTSSEGLNNLLTALPAQNREHLQNTPLFVPHPRIADNAMRAGLQHVILTTPAESGMMAGLLAYPWSPR